MLRTMRAGCWWGNLYETDHLDDLGVDGRVLKLMSEKEDGRPSTAVILLGTRTMLDCCGPHKVQRISVLAEELLASEHGLCCARLLTNDGILKLASLSVGPSSLGVQPPSQLRM